LASALTLSLPAELEKFVSRRIQEEAYADAGEYLRALIRADRRRAVEEKLERLVEEALESGPPEALMPTGAQCTTPSMRRAAPLDQISISHDGVALKSERKA